MKKILLFLLTVGLLTACYEEYRIDYEYSSVAFSYVTGGSNEPGVLWRSVVKDEGLKLDIGIYLAGILENTEDRWADFVIDPTLLDGTAYTLMPESYYTLSENSRFTIPSGEFIGRLTITLDSAAFVDDPLAVSPNYAIPFKLVDTSEDSILTSQSTQIVVLRYINAYEGFYYHTGSFQTKDEAGEVLNSAGIDNVLDLSTVFQDSLMADGLMHLIGDDFHMKLVVNADNTVSYEYVPNLKIIDTTNVAPNASLVSTSSVSDWESIDYLNDGYDPADSHDKGDGAYGNWPNGMTWNYVQYDFNTPYYISRSDVYWWTDWDNDPETLPWGGIDIPFNSYLEYHVMGTDEWVVFPDVTVNGTPFADFGETDTLVYNFDNPAPGCLMDQYNITTFDQVLTDGVRLWVIATGSQGILEWKVWGIPGAVGLEMAEIQGITPNGTNTYDPSSYTFNLNYRVDYTEFDYYTEVSSQLVWRNRIRDGINEWRRD